MNIKIIGGIVVLALVVGGFFYYRSTQNQDSGVKVVEPSDTKS